MPGDPVPAADPDLEVAPSRWARWSWVVPVAALVGVVGWYATHPNPLPDPGSTRSTTTTASAPVYVGVLALPDRTLSLRDVEVDATGGTATAFVCRGGSIAVTSEIDAFCSDVVPADGATLDGEDQLVLEVSGQPGAVVEVSAPVLTFREGLQWGRARTGRPVEVTVLG